MIMLAPSPQTQDHVHFNGNKSPVVWRRHKFESLSQVGKKHLDELDRASFFPTRFACRDIMFKMGIQDQVDDLLNRMYLWRLANMDYMTYPEPTKHFLAMVEFIEDEDIGYRHVYFMVGPNQYSLTFNEFCHVYGFPNTTFGDIQEFCEALTMWRNIAMDGAFSVTTARMSKVRNPTIRYALCLVANMIFSRHHSNTSRTYELMMLLNIICYGYTTTMGGQLSITHHSSLNSHLCSWVTPCTSEMKWHWRMNQKYTLEGCSLKSLNVWESILTSTIRY